MTVNRNNYRVYHGIFHVRVINNHLEYPLENIRLGLVIEPLEHSIPLAKIRWRISPGTTCSGLPEHNFKKKVIIHAPWPGFSGLPKQCGAIFSY